MRLDVWSRVAAHDAGGAMADRERAQQRLGEALRFVGDDAPAQVARLDLRQKLGDTFEEPRLDAQVLRVQLEEAIAQSIVALALRRRAEAGFQQAAGAARSVRTY